LDVFVLNLTSTFFTSVVRRAIAASLRVMCNRALVAVRQQSGCFHELLAACQPAAFFRSQYKYFLVNPTINVIYSGPRVFS